MTVGPTIHEAIARRVEEGPERIALRSGGEEMTYGALHAASLRIAAALGDPLRSGGTVAVLLADDPLKEIPALLGILRAGGAYAVLDATAPEPHLARLLADLSPVRVLVDGATRALGERLGARSTARVLDVDSLTGGPAPAHVVDPSSTASIVVTSGSTGAPKKVRRSHLTILDRVRLLADAHAVGPGDRVSHLFSCRFVAAEVDVWGALLSGATLSAYPLARLGLGPFPAWLRDERITHLHPPVTVFRRLLHAGPGPLGPDVRLVALAGEPVHGDDVRRFRRLFPASALLEHRFSSTETSTIATFVVDASTPVPDGVLPVGRVVDGKSVELLAEDGTPVAAGEVGWIVVTGRFLADTDADGIESRPDGERRYRTGDLGRLTADGLLVHVGRRDALLKVRGHRVSAPEVEAALLACDGVDEAAVVAGVDALGETILVAFVAANGNADPARLRSTLASRLPAPFVPARIEALAELPLTPTGKVDRQALAARAAAMEAPAASPPTNAADGKPVASTKPETLAEVWQALLGVPNVSPSDDFFALGGDSLLAAELCARIEGRFGRRLVPADLLVARTLAAQESLLRPGPRPRPAAGSLLVPIRVRGTEPPLICVHPAGGQVIGFFALARHLPPTLDVVALRGRGLDGREPPHESVAEMAAAYLETLRAARIAGPYRLVGRCVGGLVALEMACLVEAAAESAESVDVVALLEPPDLERPLARLWREVRTAFGAPDGPAREREHALETRLREAHRLAARRHRPRRPRRARVVLLGAEAGVLPTWQSLDPRFQAEAADGLSFEPARLPDLASALARELAGPVETARGHA